MVNQDSPPLDPKPSSSPAVHGGADEAGDETTDDDRTRFLYSVPKRRLLAAAGLDYLNSDATWIMPQGWVLVLDPSTRDASLRDLFTSRTVRLPPDNQESGLPSSNEHTRCLVSSSSTPRPAEDDPGCIIVLLVHLEDPVLWYCSPGGSRWFRHEYPSELIISDHSDIMGAMGRLTAARGKFYTHVFGDGYDKIMALEFSPGPIFSSIRVVRTPALSKFFQIRLVESCGDLFFLRISTEPLCAQGITGIYVYKLVLSSNNAWGKVKVDTIGENMVFFSGSCGDDSYEFGGINGSRRGRFEGKLYLFHAWC